MEPPAEGSVLSAAPPIKRAKFTGIPVRHCDGSLVAHVAPELVDRLLVVGAAESFPTRDSEIPAPPARNQR
jgi:hypothetical protein